MKKRQERFISVSRICFVALSIIILTACADGAVDEKKGNHEHTEAANLTKVDTVREGKRGRQEGSMDLQTAAKAWADAFCTRDGDALWELFDPERRDDFYETGFVQSAPEDDYIAIGWSSPWPMDYLYTIEMDGEKTLFTYYPMTSNPHRWVWKQSVSWQQKDGQWYGYQDSFVTYDEIRSAEDFAEAYSGEISGTPMDYRTDCAGWEDALENLAGEETYKELLTAPDKAAEYLLNLAGGTGTIKWIEGQIAVVEYQFEYGDPVLITMQQPEGRTIWLPEGWEENTFTETIQDHKAEEYRSLKEFRIYSEEGIFVLCSDAETYNNQGFSAVDSEVIVEESYISVKYDCAYQEKFFDVWVFTERESYENGMMQEFMQMAENSQPDILDMGEGKEPVPYGELGKIYGNIFGYWAVVDQKPVIVHIEEEEVPYIELVLSHLRWE